MNLINFTGLSKHFSYFLIRKQASGNYLRCVIDRTMRDGQYKCHHVSINGPPADQRDLTTKSENLKVMHILKILST